MAPVDGQTLAILRRDAAIFIAPSGNAIDAVTKLRGMTVGVLGNDVPTVKLLDLILQHYDVDPASVRRVDLAPEQIADAVRHRKVAAVFALAPPNSKRIPLLLAAIRRSGHGSPQIIAVDEAAAIAKRYPLLETLDIPKGTFDGSLPAPDDDITTLSVSYRLLARAAMPDWVAAEITRHVLTQKPKLAALDESLAGIEAPDTDDKSSALPIHSGTEAYLTGNLTSFSDQLQNALYWIGIAASAAVSLGALTAAAYRRVRPRQPPSRVMRLLEIWLAVRTANRGDLDGLEAETDEILDASVRADARGQAAESEVRLVSLLISHVHEAIQRRRAGNGERARGARQSPAVARRADRRTVHEHGRDRPARALQRTRGAHHPQPRLPRARRRQGSRRGPPTLRIEHVKLLGAAHPVGGTAADRKLMLLARSVRSEGLAFDSDLAGIRAITRVSAPREAGCIKKPG